MGDLNVLEIFTYKIENGILLIDTKEFVNKKQERQESVWGDLTKGQIQI